MPRASLNQAFAEIALLVEQGAVDPALTAYEAILRERPGDTAVLGNYIYLRRQACRWDGLPEITQRFVHLARETGQAHPFILSFLIDDPEVLLACAQARSARIADQAASDADPVARRDDAGKTQGRRIRLAYVSGDVCNHATATLMVEAMEAHDRDRFEVFLYCYTKRPEGILRERMLSGAEHVHRVAGQSDRAIAELMASHGIDCALDLMGHTLDARPGIFAHRPAPLQIAYLGYPGPMGAPFIDYTVADAIIAPEAERGRGFSEALLRMPISYQPNDSKRPGPDETLTRADFGLPEDALILGCFNKPVKLSPAMTSLYARIMRAVPEALLWLWVPEDFSRAGLTAHFKTIGLEGRVRFGRTLPVPRHMARLKACDLILDTFPYGGHTTTSDALACGVPVLTLQGRSFASRVAASLLSAQGLEELITRSPEDFVREAVSLLRNGARRRRLRAQAEAAAHLTPGSPASPAPLFDGRRYAQALETRLGTLLASPASGSDQCTQ